MKRKGLVGDERPAVIQAYIYWPFLCPARYNQNRLVFSKHDEHAAPISHLGCIIFASLGCFSWIPVDF
jgi:hypothetical protein